MFQCVPIEKKILVINPVSRGIKSKKVTDKLWKGLNLESNEILKQDPEICKNLYTIKPGTECQVWAHIA